MKILLTLAITLIFNYGLAQQNKAAKKSIYSNSTTQSTEYYTESFSGKVKAIREISEDEVEVVFDNKTTVYILSKTEANFANNKNLINKAKKKSLDLNIEYNTSNDHITKVTEDDSE